MGNKSLEIQLDDKKYSIDTDGCGCTLIGVAAIIVAIAIAGTLAEHGWPF